MTTTTAQHWQPQTRAVNATRRPSPARLVEVELRKATDTRAGFWMFVVQALLILGVAVSTGVTGRQWAQILSVTLLWVALPTFAGLARLARHEIK